MYVIPSATSDEHNETFPEQDGTKRGRRDRANDVGEHCGLKRLTGAAPDHHPERVIAA
jgi:hypothetical protein